MEQGSFGYDLKRTQWNSSNTRYEHPKTWRINHRSECSWGRRASFHWFWKRGCMLIWVLLLDVVVVNLILMETSMLSSKFREDLQFQGRLSFSLLRVELWQFWSSWSDVESIWEKSIDLVVSLGTISIRSIIQLENQPEFPVASNSFTSSHEDYASHWIALTCGTSAIDFVLGKVEERIKYFRLVNKLLCLFSLWKNNEMNALGIRESQEKHEVDRMYLSSQYLIQGV